MSLWTAVKGIFSSGKVIEKGVELADEAFHTEQERSEQDSKDTSEARGMALSSHSTWFDVLVDGFNRLVRPTFALWAFGELVGWWRTRPEQIPDATMNLVLLIVTFYFGGRAILKDLPGVIKMLRK